MAIDFPSSPGVGQEHTSGGMTYVYNGTGWTVKGGSTTDFVLKTGDTMTGDLTITKANPTIILNRSATGQNNDIYGASAGLYRWIVRLGDGSAETSGNAGSNFVIYRWSDAGAFLDAPLSISRATGAVALIGNLTITKVLPQIILNKTTDTVNEIIGQKNGLNRWGVNVASGAAETGSNAGSDFSLRRYTDAGALIDSPLIVNRANGYVAITSTVASTNSTTGALVVSGGVGVAGSINVAGSVSTSGYLTSFNSSIGYGISLATNNASVAGGPISFANSASAQVGSVSYTAGQTGVAYNTSSGAELKEDLKSFDAGSIIDNTEVYDFAWKSTKERAFGVIAQQAVDVYPQAITHQEASTERGSERDEWWGVDYSKYVPVLLQELKALRARVAELEGRTPVEKPTTTPKKR